MIIWVIKSFFTSSQQDTMINLWNTTGWIYIDYNADILPTLSGDIVLFFHADRCPTCRQAEKNFLDEGIPSGLTILKVNYDKEIKLKEKYAILTQTSFAYVKSDGTLIKRWVGGLTIWDIVDKINEAKVENGIIDTRTWSNQRQKAYFAGWCFRCMEWPFEALRWVQEVTNWYIGGDEKDAHYNIVSQWTTKHREAIEVIYDPALITYAELLKTYRRQIDPTDNGGQFADRGYQYTTAIYYSWSEEAKIAQASKKELEDSKKFTKPIAVQILPNTTFYPAEEYHQDYYKKNIKNYENYKKWSGRKDFIETNWKDIQGNQENIDKAIANLTTEQKKILFEWWTEPPFHNAYRDNHEAGIYVDVIDWTPLFSSTDKFDSGTGWPSFTRPIDEALLWENSDMTLWIERTEIKSSSSNGHLWHVFDDGPSDKWWKRYCINSAALRFVPYADLDKEWYSKYKILFNK